MQRCKTKKLLAFSSPGFLPRSAPQGADAAHAGRRGAFAALPGQAAAGGDSQGKNLVSSLHPSSHSFPPNSGPKDPGHGDEKVQREGRIQLWQPHLPECDRPTPSYLSHSIMVLSFQIVTPSLYSPPPPFTARTHPKAPAANSSLVCSSLPRSASAQTWTPMDGWYLGDSPGWFGSILSVHSPHHWATVCSLKVEPTSVLCSSRPPRLKGLASLQPATAFCPVPSRGPHRAFGMKSARNTRPPHAQSHRNWGLHG